MPAADWDADSMGAMEGRANEPEMLLTVVRSPDGMGACVMDAGIQLVGVLPDGAPGRPAVLSIWRGLPATGCESGGKPPSDNRGAAAAQLLPGPMSQENGSMGFGAFSRE